MGRSGATSPAAAEHVKRLAARGVQVTVVKGDVSVLEDVERAVKTIEEPIAGVVHAAMDLDVSDFGVSMAAETDFGRNRCSTI